MAATISLTVSPAYILIDRSSTDKDYILTPNIDSVQMKGNRLIFVTRSNNTPYYFVDYADILDYNGGGVPAIGTIVTDISYAMRSPNEILEFAPNGTVAITGGSEVTGLNLGAVVGAEAETVISAMDVNGAEADLDDYGLTAFKLNVGVPFWLPEGEAITAITLTSGSLIGINR